MKLEKSIPAVPTSSISSVVVCSKPQRLMNRCNKKGEMDTHKHEENSETKSDGTEMS